MAQHDYIVDDGSGLVVRTDMNAVLAAIVSNNSGASEPAVKYPGMWWLDTSTVGGVGVLKLRNKANDGWIILPTSTEYLPVTGGSILGDLNVTGDFDNPEYNRVVGSHAGVTEPSLPVPGMLWLDTTVAPGVMKIRNAANTGWVLASPTNAPTFQTSVTVNQVSGAAYIDLISTGEKRRIVADPTNNWLYFTNPSESATAIISDSGDLWTAATGNWLSALLNAKQNNLGYVPVRQNGGNVVYLWWDAPGYLYAQVDATFLGYVYTSQNPPPAPGQTIWARGDYGAVTFANSQGYWGGNVDQGGGSLRYGWDDGHGGESLPGVWRNLGGSGNGDLNYVAQRRG